MAELALRFAIVWGNPFAIDQRRMGSRLGWVWSVVWMVQGERVRGAGVGARCGGNWMGLSFGDSLEALYEAMEDIFVWG
jgi:hypothetical protein